MPRKDFTQIAFDVVQQATGAVVRKPESVKAMSGRKGGLKGGKTRMDQLTEAERVKLAKNAADKRWKKPAPNPKGAGKSKAS